MGSSTYTSELIPPSELSRRCKVIKDKFFPAQQPLALVILDIETTGVNSIEDWPYELAALFVIYEQGKYNVLHSFHSYIDWVGSGVADTTAFTARLDATNKAMMEKDPDLRRPDVHEIAALGKHPHNVFGDFSKAVQGFFASAAPATPAMCGHNVFSFDANCLHHAYAKAGMISPVINTMLDTGLIVKAAQIWDNYVDPVRYHYLTDWILKVRGLRSRVKWSLSNFCGPTFGLKEKLPDYTLGFQHTALTDVWMVYSLLQMFDNQPEPTNGNLGNGH